MEEARNVLASGERSVGGIQIGLERWSPKFGCSTEREARNKAWVRILGLPISLWVPTILKRVGEVCGGFLGIDPLTERKEDLEWARILIKLNGEVLPSSMEIGVEGEVHALSLWWEIPSALRKKQGDGRDGLGRQRGEVRGDGDSRARWRVGEMPGVGPKEQCRSDDVTGKQVGGEGRGKFENWAQLGRVTRQSSGSAGDGSCSSGPGVGPVGLKRDFGPTTQGQSLSRGAELAATGLERGPAEGRASEGLELLSHGPALCLGTIWATLRPKSLAQAMKTI